MTSLSFNGYGLSFMHGYVHVYFHKNESILNSYIVCCGVHSENAWIPNDFVCLDCCAGGGSVFGNSPKYKGDSAQFFF